MKLATCNNGHDVRLTTSLVRGTPICSKCQHDKANITVKARPRTQKEIDHTEQMQLEHEHKRRQNNNRIGNFVDRTGYLQ